MHYHTPATHSGYHVCVIALLRVMDSNSIYSRKTEDIYPGHEILPRLRLLVQLDQGIMPTLSYCTTVSSRLLVKNCGRFVHTLNKWC